MKESGGKFGQFGVKLYDRFEELISWLVRDAFCCHKSPGRESAPCEFILGLQTPESFKLEPLPPQSPYKHAVCVEVYGLLVTAPFVGLGKADSII